MGAELVQALRPTFKKSGVVLQYERYVPLAHLS